MGAQFGWAIGCRWDRRERCPNRGCSGGACRLDRLWERLYPNKSAWWSAALLGAQPRWPAWRWDNGRADYGNTDYKLDKVNAFNANNIPKNKNKGLQISLSYPPPTERYLSDT